MGNKMQKPASKLVRQQAEDYLVRLEAISRAGKAFDKLVSELQAFQLRRQSLPFQQS